MESLSPKAEPLIAITYELSEHLSTIGPYPSTILVMLSQAFSLAFMLFPREFVKYSVHNATAIPWIVLAGALYTLLVSLILGVLYFLTKFKLFTKKLTRDKIREVLIVVLSYLLFPTEYLVYEWKSTLIALWIFTNPLQEDIQKGYSTEYYMTFLVIIIIDYIITLWLCLFKIRYLRQEVADGSYFSRVPCKSESLYILSVPIVKWMGLLTNKYTFNDVYNLDSIFLKSQNSVNYSYYFVSLAIFLVQTGVFLTELPYFHSVCERCIAHAMLSSLVVESSIGITQYSYTQIAKIVCLFFPFQIVLIEIYLDKIYEDKLEFSQHSSGLNLHKIKIILSGNAGRGANNAIKNRFLKRLITKNQQIMQKDESQIFNSIVNEQEASILALMKKNGIDTRNIEMGTNNDKSGEWRNYQHLDIKDDIYYLKLSKFVEENRFSQFCCLIKLDWMLKKKFIILEILNLVNRILMVQEDFKSKYVSYCALKLVEKKLLYFYKMKELTDNGYKDLNNIGLDLDTVLNYKKYMSKLTERIELFSTLNKKNVQMIMSENAPLQTIYQTETQLYDMNQRIITDFQVLHEYTLRTEYFHLIPYFYHLLYNLNLYRSSKKIYNIYLSRYEEVRKTLQNSSEIKLDNLSVLHNSTTFLCDSNKSTLSLIRNVYGNKSNKYQRCIDKYPDVILPKVQNVFHYQAMRNYMMADNTGQIRNINIGFTRMPNDHLLTKSVIIIKIVPSMKKEFNFMVNLMEKQQQEDYFILVNQEMMIDSYSRNLTKVVEKRFLTPNIPIGSVSTRAAEFIKRALNEARGRENEMEDANQKQNRRMKNETTGEGKATNPATGGQYEYKSKQTYNSNKSGHTSGSRNSGVSQEVHDKALIEMSNKREEFFDDFVFGQGAKKSYPKNFHVRIAFNKFNYIAGGYFLIRLRDIKAIKQGDVKRKCKQYLSNKGNEDFILNFSYKSDNRLNNQNLKVLNVTGFSEIEDEYELHKQQQLANYNSQFAQRGNADPNLNASGPNPNGKEHPTTPSRPRPQSHGKVIVSGPYSVDNRHGSENITSNHDFRNNLANLRADGRAATLPGADNQTTNNFDMTGDLSDHLFDKKMQIKNGGGQDNHHHSNDNQLIIPSVAQPANRIELSRSLSEEESGGENSKEVLMSEERQKGKDRIKIKEDQRFAAGSSIYTADTSMGYKHNKMIFEDVCTRKTAPFEIIFTRIHFVSSILFVTAFLLTIILISLQLNNKFDSMNEFYLQYQTFKMSMNLFTNRVLFQYGIDKGIFLEDRYAKFNRPDTNNFSLANKEQILTISNQFESNFKELVSIIVRSQEKVSDLLFNSYINTSTDFTKQYNVSGVRTSDGLLKIDTIQMSVFEGFILESYSKITKYVHGMRTQDFKPFYRENKEDLITKGYTYPTQYFTTYDVLNEHPMNKIERTLADQMGEFHYTTLVIILATMLIAIILNFGLACVQFLLVRNLTKRIFRAFSSFHLITENHYTKRVNQIADVVLLMRDIKECNYMISDSHRKENFKMYVKKIKNVMNEHSEYSKTEVGKLGKGFEGIDVASRTKRARYSKNSYHFNLLNSFIIIFLKSLCILGYILLIYFQFSQKISKKSNLFEKEKAVNSLSLDSMELYNYFLADYLFHDPELLLFKLRAEQGISKLFNEVSSTWFERVEFIFTRELGQLEPFISSFQDVDSCSLPASITSSTPSTLSTDPTLCSFGTLGLGKQPLYFGLLGMSRVFLDYYILVRDGKDFNVKQKMFDEVRNVEWEYYVNNIYYPSLHTFVDAIKLEFNSSYNNANTQSIRLVVLYTILFVLLYSSFSFFAVRNITRQIQISKFSLQIYSMKSVLENNKIKTRFVEFFRISNREFI